MFFVGVGTHSKCVINDFTLTPRIDILIFQCHTVTNGTDLRKSPLLQCSSQRLYLFSQECSKTISSLQAAQFINMTSTHSPNSFLTRLHGKAAQIRAPRQSRQKARFLKMPLEKDNPKHRDTSNNLDEMFKDSNVWNKVDDLLFLTRIFFFRIRL